MTDTMLTNEMKRQAVVVVLKADHVRSLRVTRSFVDKICKELEKENDYVMSISKRKKYCTSSDSMRTPEFIHKVKQTINENWGQSIRSIAKRLHVSEKTIKRSVHDDIRYKFYVMNRGHFISEKSNENHLNRSKSL